MKLSVVIPVFNQIEETKSVWGCHVQNITDKDNVELVVIDNGSTDNTREFIDKFVFPHFPDHLYVHNQENIGVVASMQQAVNVSKGDVIAILHNDLYVYQLNWDERVLSAFKKNDKLGLSGFLGAKGVHQNGGREHVVSNMLEAEIHGRRSRSLERVAIFDGMSLIGRRKMFEDVGGFDQNFAPHHFYDKAISVDSIMKGWENWMIPIYCHHISGITANRPDYQTWADQRMSTANFTGDKASLDKSERYFIEKYRGVLPVIV